jgi:hypothetical protein
MPSLMRCLMESKLSWKKSILLSSKRQPLIRRLKKWAILLLLKVQLRCSWWPRLLHRVLTGYGMSLRQVEMA